MIVTFCFLGFVLWCSASLHILSSIKYEIKWPVKGNLTLMHCSWLFDIDLWSGGHRQTRFLMNGSDTCCFWRRSRHSVSDWFLSVIQALVTVNLKHMFAGSRNVVWCCLSEVWSCDSAVLVGQYWLIMWRDSTLLQSPGFVTLCFALGIFPLRWLSLGIGSKTCSH